jgi:hypothetical protein
MKPSAVPCLLVLLASLAGCGGESDTTSSTAAKPGGKRYFRDYPGQRETTLHISAADCRALARMVERQTGRPVRRSGDPSPPNSHCRLEGRGVHVTISLDSAYAARQRYENRMVEQVQFNAADPAKDPHHVAGVGDPAAGEHFASWIPAYSTLFAVRGNRWITLTYPITGQSRPRRLAGATALARSAFRLTAR